MNTSLPQLLRSQIPESIHLDWEKLCASHSFPAVNSIRNNPSKYDSQFEAEASIPWCRFGKYLAERPAFTFDPLLHAGCYYVQEASSMFLEYALIQHLNFQSKLRILDLCAAPGGKSTHIASLMNDESLLISNEVIGTRVNVLTENIIKWGKKNTWVSNNDPVHFSKTPHFFDLLLVDAPCSGSGLFRKIPDYLEDWNPDLVQLCARRQMRILHDAYPALSQNGLLVYMTCSLSEAENEHMLDYMLTQFELESLQVRIPDDWGIVESRSRKHAAFGYRFFPHLLQGEGFFIALLRKKDGEESKNFVSGKKLKEGQIHTGSFFDSKGHCLFLQQDYLIAVPDDHFDDYNFLSGKLKLVKKGLLIGKQLPKDIIPSHELALYSKYQNYPFHIDVDLNQAIAYLKRETLFFDQCQKGWNLVRYKGFHLGWIKNLGNRFNNYYPSNYRILSRNTLTP